MSRSRIIDQWERDLPGLTDDGVRERVQMAETYIERSLSPGIGRNPKAAKMWRGKLGAAQAELEKRSLRSRHLHDRP